MFDIANLNFPINPINNEQKKDTLPSNISKPPDYLEPGIYQMVKHNGNITLEYESYIITTPELIFGLTKERVLRFWKRFIKQETSLGVLSVGSPGAGKTMESDLLSNLFVLKGSLPVIKITGFNVDEKVIQYIQQLDNCCLYFDEFSKHVSWNSQRLLLPLLTNANKKFLVLLTENNKNEISNFILNRTGRVRYIVEHDKLEKEVVLDYLSLFGIDNKFKNELLERYEKAITFSFDNLMAIVSEYQDNPHENLDEILRYLNITSIKKAMGYKLTKVISINNNNQEKPEEEIQVETPFILDKSRLELDKVYVYFSPMKPSVPISKDDLIENVNNRMVFQTPGYKFYFTYE